MGKKKVSRDPRPLDWLSDASPEEIGEALLSIDEAKAYRVAAYLGGRIPPELARLVEGAQENISRDPVGTVGTALLSGLRGAFNGR